MENNHIRCIPYESGVYFGKLMSVKQTYNYLDKSLCQLTFSLSLIVGYRNKDEQGNFINYDAWVEKNYKELEDPIRQVAQQKEIVSVVATILGMSEQRINEELLPSVPFDTACEFYQHVANYVTKVAEELYPEKKRIDHPYRIRMEQFKDRAYPKLGADWIESCNWTHVTGNHHEDILAQKTAYRVTEKVNDKWVISQPVTLVGVSNGSSAGAAPSSKKDGKEEVVLTVDPKDPFGANNPVTDDDLPF